MVSATVAAVAVPGAVQRQLAGRRKRGAAAVVLVPQQRQSRVQVSGRDGSRWSSSDSSRTSANPRLQVIVVMGDGDGDHLHTGGLQLGSRG